MTGEEVRSLEILVPKVVEPLEDINQTKEYTKYLQKSILDKIKTKQNFFSVQLSSKLKMHEEEFQKFQQKMELQKKADDNNLKEGIDADSKHLADLEKKFAELQFQEKQRIEFIDVDEQMSKPLNPRHLAADRTLNQRDNANYNDCYRMANDRSCLHDYAKSMCEAVRYLRVIFPGKNEFIYLVF